MTDYVKPLTVGELIAALSGIDPSQRVVVDGYEGGFSDIRIQEGGAVLGVSAAYCGDHAYCDEGDGLARVLVLGRDDYGTPWAYDA